MKASRPWIEPWKMPLCEEIGLGNMGENRRKSPCTGVGTNVGTVGREPIVSILH